MPKSKIRNLDEVLTWLYGSKERNLKPVIEGPEDISRLGEMLTNDKGLLVLRGGRKLKEAYENVRPAAAKLAESLLQAREAIQTASHNLRGFDGRSRELVEIAEDIYETAGAVCTRLPEKVATESAAGSEA